MNPDQRRGWAGDFAARFGEAALLSLAAAVGGQRRYVPQPQGAERSALAREIGPAAAQWLAERFGGETVEFPNLGARSARGRAQALKRDVAQALTTSAEAANDLARRHGVTHRHILRIRAQVRGDDADDLPLLRGLTRDPGDRTG